MRRKARALSDGTGLGKQVGTRGEEVTGISSMVEIAAGSSSNGGRGRGDPLYPKSKREKARFKEDTSMH
jgi:hypothetical protein